MAGTGGARKGAGRKKGSTALTLAKRPATKAELEDIGAMARPYCAMALETLSKIARSGESESARVSASSALLDRGYGKPKQTVDGTFQGKMLVGWLSD